MCATTVYIDLTDFEAKTNPYRSTGKMGESVDRSVEMGERFTFAGRTSDKIAIPVASVLSVWTTAKVRLRRFQVALPLRALLGAA